MSTRLVYFDAVLSGLGLPHGQAQTFNLLAWSAAESGTEPCDGTHGAKANPLNTTLDAPGTTNYNSVGVKNYPTFGAGVAATVETLRFAPYAGIRGVLARGGGPAEFAQAVEGSPWGTGAAILGGIQAVTGHVSEYAQLPCGDGAPPPVGPHLTWRVEAGGKVIHQGPRLAHALAIIGLHAHHHTDDAGWHIRLLRLRVGG